jgi:hypothetical protein
VTPPFRGGSQRGIPADCERTDQGLQIVAPGIAPVSVKARLEMRSAEPLRGRKAQKPCDIGLFDEVARRQLDLF